MSSQQQIATLASQVGELAEINKTLKHYLEEVVSRVAPEDATRLIETESERLKEARQLAAIEAHIILGATSIYGTPIEEVRDVFVQSNSLDEFVSLLKKKQPNNVGLNAYLNRYSEVAEDPNIMEFNNLRQVLGLSQWPLKSTTNTGQVGK